MRTYCIPGNVTHRYPEGDGGGGWTAGWGTGRGWVTLNQLAGGISFDHQFIITIIIIIIKITIINIIIIIFRIIIRIIRIIRIIITLLFAQRK